MEIRLSQMQDLTTLMALFDEARKTIAALGIDQWQDGYPSEAVIREDMDQKRSYIVEKDGAVLGTFVLVEQEPDYDKIYEGHWQNDDYIAIHRVAVSVSARGTGVSDRIIRYAAQSAKTLNRSSLRIDTHRGNIPMRRMLEKQGFFHRGQIFLSDGSPRVAYEKSLW